MGEARRRGTSKERREAAIKRNKEELIKALGGKVESADSALRAGISPFFDRLPQKEWEERRSLILKILNEPIKTTLLADAPPIRVQDDEITWYLFLCKQALENPLCLDVTQLARAAPFFASIGERWVYAKKVKGLDKKIDDLLYRQRKEPDGLIFEILVALSYAEAGWDVEFLEEKPPTKSPDMRVTMDGLEVYVECKRLARRTSYAERERDDFYRLWDAAKGILWEKRQWVWFKAMFHVELSELNPNYLADIFRTSLPLGNGEIQIYDGPEATIQARKIDKHAVIEHLKNWRVKANSTFLKHLLGGDWAPINSSVTMAHLVKTSQVVDCEAPVLGTYIDIIDWACGFTRDFDSEVSINKKAKEVTKHLADAIKQVPNDAPSVIHIAAETLEGADVERLRTQKVMKRIRGFNIDKPVLAMRFHRLQANESKDQMWLFDETVETYTAKGFSADIFPVNVITPSSTEMKKGSHWELYS